MQYFSRFQQLKDLLGIVGFVGAIIIGAWLINSLVFRTFNVVGPSMEPTLQTNDRLIISRLPVTFNALTGNDYTPERGEVVVFKNPLHVSGGLDEFIVKRVIGLPGERVVVDNGEVTVYNNRHPEGLHPYDSFPIEDNLVRGSVDTLVPEDELFVIGDNRAGESSFDSRNGLGTIPLANIVGPVAARVFPFTKFTLDL